jgi:16S rRNA (uracil1498-N3)-methyltransferase
VNLFYTPGIPDNDLYLSEEESRHCIKVLRLTVGDEITLVDGKGGFYKASVKLADPRKTKFTITSSQHEYQKRGHYLHMAVAPTKNIDRFEWFLEKATEIGIDEITPLICDRSERREVKIERLNKVITSAMKQSIKAYHPKLNPAQSFRNFIKEKKEGQTFIAHCMDTEKNELKEKITIGNNYVILVGPEGDFSNTEANTATQNGYVAISLGNSRLRTETAALEACFEVNFLNR